MSVLNEQNEAVKAILDFIKESGLEVWIVESISFRDNEYKPEDEVKLYNKPKKAFFSADSGRIHLNVVVRRKDGKEYSYFAFQYTMGVGLVKELPPQCYDRMDLPSHSVDVGTVHAFKYSGKDKTLRGLHGFNDYNSIADRFDKMLLSWLSSWQSEISSFQGGVSCFEEWCDEYGIGRDAENKKTYKACKREYYGLQKFFGRQLFHKFLNLDFSEF